MSVSVVTLSENTVALPGVLGEWGLSILVELDDFKVLLDTGASISVVHNATVMGIDISTVDKIVLSHGHFDHTGGLQQVLGAMKKNIDVVAHPDVWGAKHVRRPFQPGYIYAGIPFQRDALESLGASFMLSPEPVWLTGDVVTTGEIPMVTEYEDIDPGMFVKKGEEFLPDELLDDRAIVVKTSQGSVVICGCAHRGVINTLRHAQSLTGEECVHAVIGGIHLFRSSEERLELTIADLREMGVQRIGVSHCTGLPASARIAQEFGEGFFYSNTGMRMNF